MILNLSAGLLFTQLFTQLLTPLLTPVLVVPFGWLPQELQEEEASRPIVVTSPELPDGINRCLEALQDPEFLIEGRYQATRYLVRYYSNGLHETPEVVSSVAEAFAVRSLEGLRGEDTEATRLAAGAAARLARLVPTARVKQLLVETLFVRLGQMPWRRQFFDDLCEIGLVEALPFFEEYVDRYRSLDPSELASADYEYPLGDALSVVGRLGGEEQMNRISSFLDPAIPGTIRYHAVIAMGSVDHDSALDVISGSVSEDAPIWLRQCAAEILAKRGRWEGVDRLIGLSGSHPAALKTLSYVAGRPLDDKEAAVAWRDKFADRSLERALVDGMEEDGLSVRWNDLSTLDGLDALLTAAEVGNDHQRESAWGLFVGRTGVDPSSGDFWSISSGNGTAFSDRPTDPEDVEPIRARQRGFVLEARAWLSSNRDLLKWDPVESRFTR